jgi:hypothetical protein
MNRHKLDVNDLEVQSFYVSDSEAASMPPGPSGYPWCTVAGECASFFVCGALEVVEGPGPNTV